MDNNKSIKCDVESCKYNNASDKYCTLNEIKVSATCSGCNAKKKQTICDSFKKIYFLLYCGHFYFATVCGAYLTLFYI